MESVRIERVGDALYVSVPFTKLFNGRAKRIGGRYDGERRAWSFRAIDANAVRALVVDLFGQSALERGTPELADVRIKVGPGGIRADVAEVEFCGRVVARRTTRDSRVQCWAVLEDGPEWPSSGGSAKYPAVAPDDENRVLLLRDFPVSLLRHASDAERDAIVTGEDRRGQLEDEARALEARLAAIRAELAALGKKP